VKQGPQPPRLVVWWEGLETWLQLTISFPIYGLFEGAVLSGLMAVATRTERGRRG
jgi:hypothetical protein